MNAKEQIELVDSTQASNISVDTKCGRCAKSICCNSINKKITTPKSKEDFDHLLWPVSHENINVFKGADGWFLHIFINCSHLLPGGVCRI